MKLGIALKLDVAKLDKARFFRGKKGVYADLTCFVDTENTSQYGDNGVISQSVSQEERQNGVKLPILGNAKIFYTDGSSQHNERTNDTHDSQPDDSQDVPF